MVCFDFPLYICYKVLLHNLYSLLSNNNSLSLEVNSSFTINCYSLKCHIFNILCARVLSAKTLHINQMYHSIQRIHSFIVIIHFILVRVMMDLESIPGTPGVRWEYTGHHLPTHSHTHLDLGKI